MSINQPQQSQIVIVDDLPANLRLLMNVLESQGYDVRAFSKGDLALEGLQYFQPDLILLDIHMPEMNGYQICECLKLNPKTQNIPVIFISALNEAFDKVKAFEKGGVDYITKPFNEEEVWARVAMHLKLAHLTKKLAEINDQQAEQLVIQNEQLEIAIEKLQKQQLQVERANAFLEQVLNAIPDALFVQNELYEFVMVNTMLCKITNCLETDLLGQLSENCLPPDQAEIFSKKPLSPYRHYSISEDTLVLSNQERHILLTQKVSFRTETGEQYYLGLSRDITDLKNIEQILVVQQQQLAIAQQVQRDSSS